MLSAAAWHTPRSYCSFDEWFVRKKGFAFGVMWVCWESFPYFVNIELVH